MSANHCFERYIKYRRWSTFHCSFYRSSTLGISNATDQIRWDNFISGAITQYVGLHTDKRWMKTVVGGSTFHIHLCIWGWQHLQKKPPPNVISPIICFAILISLWGSTQSRLCWMLERSYRQLPATVSNVCTTDVRVGGVGLVPPPPTKIRLLRWLSRPIIKLELSESCCSMYTKCIQCQYRIYNLLNIYLIQWTDFVYFLKTVKYSPFEHIWVVILHIVWSVCDVIGVTWWHLIGDILSEICTKFHPPGCIFWSWTSSLQNLPAIFWKHVVYVIY